jgi:hypothetical protein
MQISSNRRLLPRTESELLGRPKAIIHVQLSVNVEVQTVEYRPILGSAVSHEKTHDNLPFFLFFL